MYKLIVFSVFCIAAATAFETVEDDEGNFYYLVPIQHHRERRQTSVGVTKTNPGFRVTGSHQGTIFNSNGHRLDGGASISKPFRPSGPATVGGQLGYSHAPSGSNLNLGAQHTGRYGTDFGASGNANIWRGKNARLDAVGNYNRHYGGAGGTGKPNYYGGLQFSGRF